VSAAVPIAAIAMRAVRMFRMNCSSSLQVHAPADAYRVRRARRNNERSGERFRD
jgi:hypothetical protein